MKILISTGNTDPVNYVRAVREAGGDPTARYLPKPELSFDGLILAGGGDIDPARYGQTCAGSETPDIRRDSAELALLSAYAQAGKPILGICRGHQLLNVWAGGTLIQDLGAGNDTHRGTEAGDRWHEVISEPDSILFRLSGAHFSANSSHHQAADVPGKGLRITARSSDGTAEGLEHCSLPVFSVQFHPERMGEDGQPVFRYFLDLCRRCGR